MSVAFSDAFHGVPFAAPRASGEPAAVMERGAALTRLLADVQSLPSQQRSALLMRELQGLTYE